MTAKAGKGLMGVLLTTTSCGGPLASVLYCVFFDVHFFPNTITHRQTQQAQNEVEKLRKENEKLQNQMKQLRLCKHIKLVQCVMYVVSC